MFLAVPRTIPLTKEALRHAALERQDAELWRQLTLHVFTEPEYQPNSLRTYRTALTLVMTYLRSPAPEHGFDFRDFQRWLAERGYQPATVSKRLAQTRVLLKALLGETLRLTLPRSSAQELTSLPYTDAEVQRLRVHAHVEERLLLMLVLEAGLTAKDMTNLRRSDIKLGPYPVLLLWPQGRPAGSHEPEDKRGIAVPLSPLLSAELQRWFARAPVMGQRDQVIPNPSQDTINARLRDLCRRADVPCRGLRGLRVTAGARAYRESGSLQMVMARLRLKTVQQAQAYARTAAALGRDQGQFTDRPPVP